jgi:hypothetical protein
MYRHEGRTVWLRCGVVAVWLASASAVRADLLGFWPANSPNPDLLIPNDQGNSDLDGELFGGAAYSGDATGVTGQPGDYALEFLGTDEDYAVLPASEGLTYEEITLTAWLNGAQTGDWSGIFQARGTPPIGIGYNAGTSRLTYTWNNDAGNTYGFGGTAAGEVLVIPENEWTFVALSLTSNSATLFVGPKDGPLQSATNEIPHLAQLPSVDWRLGEDDCCGTERNFLGLIDEAALWNHALLPQEISQLHARTALPTDFLEPSDELPQVQVAGPGLGIESLSGTLSNIVNGPPEETQGLAQYWYEGNMRANVDAFFAAGDEGSEANPLVTSGPFASDTTWWAGSQNTATISDMELPNYPDGLAGTRFDGSTGQDNYGVRLTGEIFIPADGEYLIRDGIDDFTLVAIDQDGNGELDEYDTLTNADVGNAGFGDILVLDDDWANLDGSSQESQYHGFALFENIDGDGEWRQIEIWMSEAGGGDGGILYMGNLDDPDIFDDLNPDALTQEERDKFVIRNEDLRSVVSQVVSGDADAELRTDVEFVMQVAPEGNDQFAVDDGDGLYTTTLDVDGATVRVQIEGELQDGAAFTLFDADNLAGIDSLNLLLDDPSLWDLSNLGAGQIIFGTAQPADCNGDGVVDIQDANCTPVDQLDDFLASIGSLRGDADGDGEVGFSDFVILSNNYNAPGEYTDADFDKDGTVAFGDFVLLSNNYGQSAAGAAAVPEPAGLSLLGLGMLLLLGVSRRRTSR